LSASASERLKVPEMGRAGLGYEVVNSRKRTGILAFSGGQPKHRCRVEGNGRRRRSQVTRVQPGL
jgi:hypothetical protein